MDFKVSVVEEEGHLQDPLHPHPQEERDTIRTVDDSQHEAITGGGGGTAAARNAPWDKKIFSGVWVSEVRSG